MFSKALIFFLLAAVNLNLAHAQPVIPTVNCYNDDSIDIINQDQLPAPQYPNGPVFLPAPADCVAAPRTEISQKEGSSPVVLVDGKAVYSSSTDPVIEARVSFKGVAILTARGSLYTYGAGGLNRWYSAGTKKIAYFKLARNGALAAILTDGELVVSDDRGNMKRVRSSAAPIALLAARSGRVAALFDDGSIWSEDQFYAGRTDPAVAVKVSASGIVAWQTSEGSVGTTANTTLHKHRADPVVSFKVGAAGHVAYLTSNSVLWRDGVKLVSGREGIRAYVVLSNGDVSGQYVNGRSFWFAH